MRSKVLRRLLPLAGAVLVLVASAQPAAAVSAIQFGRIQYDSPGTDNRTNSSLNGEYVVLRNHGSHGFNMKGYTLRDAASHVYTFTSNFVLGAGKSVTVHTGKGTNTSTHRYWGSGNYIWNNTGDHAYLRSARGTTLDTCVWTAKGAGYKNC